MKYDLLCLQISGRHITFSSKHNYQVSTELYRKIKDICDYKQENGFLFSNYFQEFYSWSDQPVISEELT